MRRGFVVSAVIVPAPSLPPLPDTRLRHLETLVALLCSIFSDNAGRTLLSSSPVPPFSAQQAIENGRKREIERRRSGLERQRRASRRVRKQTKTRRGLGRAKMILKMILFLTLLTPLPPSLPFPLLVLLIPINTGTSDAQLKEASSPPSPYRLRVRAA